MLGKKKVLHIEDTEVVRIGMEYLFGSRYEWHSLSTLVGHKESLLSGEESFDLIILDGNIDDKKGGDGWEFALELHNSGKNVLILSGDVSKLEERYMVLKREFKSAATRRLIECVSQLLSE